MATSHDSNLERQQQEHEALEAIYGPELYNSDSGYDRTWLFKVPTPNDDYKLQLLIHIPAQYPAHEPPIAELESVGDWLSPQHKQEIVEALHGMYVPGEEVLFSWTLRLVEFVDEWCCDHSAGVHTIASNSSNQEPSADESNTESIESTADDAIPSSTKDSACPMAHATEWPLELIVHGDPIIDRKSVFIAHLASVHSMDDVRCVVNTLKLDRKIARATHNIVAFRLTLPTGGLLQDCDDDGESAAGGRLLHLLQIVDARNVVVVVSRWYGGIQLGPDRFKHINNAARQLLAHHGYIRKEGGVGTAAKDNSRKGKLRGNR